MNELQGLRTELIIAVITKVSLLAFFWIPNEELWLDLDLPSEILHPI